MGDSTDLRSNPIPSKGNCDSADTDTFSTWNDHFYDSLAWNGDNGTPATDTAQPAGQI